MNIWGKFRDYIDLGIFFMDPIVFAAKTGYFSRICICSTLFSVWEDKCNESNWMDVDTEYICSDCSVVALHMYKYKTCRNFCARQGLECQSTSEIKYPNMKSCERASEEKSSCDVEIVFNANTYAICSCSPQIRRSCQRVPFIKLDQNHIFQFFSFFEFCIDFVLSKGFWPLLPYWTQLFDPSN